MSLPEWARVAFSARCARRVEPYFEQFVTASRLQGVHLPEADKYMDRLSQAIAIAEMASISAKTPDSVAATSIQNDTVVAGSIVWDWYDEVCKYDMDGALATAAYGFALLAEKSAKAAASAIASALNPDNSIQTVEIAQSCSNTQATQSLESVLKTDFEQIIDVVSAMWTQQTPFPANFFGLRSQFDTKFRVHGRSIVEIVSAVQLRAMEMVGNPKKMFSLKPREFEELVAEILAGFGFDIELTAHTRDGGRDIIAINYDPISVKYLIECKRYSSDRPVGIDVVQRLHGVTYSEHATKGIIVTTSRFTQPARVFMEQEKWLLEGRDFDGLVTWLDKYQKALLRKIIL
jgi:restriction system protein